MIKKLLATTLVCAMSLTGLFANGTNEKQSGPLELHFSNFSTEGEAHYPLVTESIKTYNKVNEGKVKIYDDKLPSAAYTTNIQAVAASNDLPTICMLRASQAQQYGENGIVIPLNDLMEQYGLAQRLKEGTTLESSVNGVCYAIPWRVGYYGFILYNQDIFNKVGIDHFPKNLDEFKTTCDALRAAGYIPMSLGDKDLWGADSLLFSSFVNKFVGQDWTNGIIKHDGTSSFTDPEFIQALTAFQKIANDKTFNDNFTSLDANDARLLYSQGKAAMTSTGDWMCGLITSEAPEVAKASKAACWPGPAMGAKSGDVMEHSSAWCISLSSKNTDEENAAAMDYLANYQMTPEWGEKLLANGGGLAAWEITIKDGDVDPLLQKVYELETGVCLNWDSVLDPSVREIYQRGLQSVLTNTLSPMELAKQMQAEYDLD